MREKISRMAAPRALAYIASAKLRPDEEVCLIERDVHGRSCAQICEKLNVSPETVNRARRRALDKLIDLEAME